MAYILNYCLNAADSKLLEKEFCDVLALISEDNWQIDSCIKLGDYIEKLNKHSQTDISCFDVTTDGSVEVLEELRKNNKSTMLVLISDMTVSPLKYMKPALMAGALILKPLESSNVSLVVKDVLNAVCLTEDNEMDDKRFCIETKEGKRLIPFEKIVYFEAREKKIFVNTFYEEYSFYSSLDELEHTLPKGFVRCHRSFIVNRKMITRILFPRNMVCCGENVVIPLSRSYKPILKEVVESESYGR